MSTGMFDSFVTRHWFNDEAKAIWSDHATLQAWLTVEAALARAQAELGIIPQAAAQTIAEKADASAFDMERLSSDIAFAQHPFVPVLRQYEALCGEPAAGFIHWGATTQNIFDTAASLQMFQSHRVLSRHLDAAIEALCTLAQQHRDTVQAGRTHGQHALPMTFGFKLAGWMDELDRDRSRLNQRLSGAFVASLGGAIGTFAAMAGQGRAVEVRMAAHLGLAPAGLPMRSSYDRVSDFVAALGLLAGTAQKIAQDVVFMQRTEIGEVEEAFHLGKVGSSTMAQKRNPSSALMLTSLARMLRARVPLALEAMVRMDEGDSSATNVTDALLPEIAILATSVAETLAQLVRGLVVHPEAMRLNLELSQGLIASEAVMMRLTALMGRHEAHHLLYDAAQRTVAEGIPFLEAICTHAMWGTRALPDDLAQSLQASAYVGDSAAIAVETAARLARR
ncbi:3-carboxy-cis,cis-muconate cycloisomerase [Rhodoferax sp. OV413]|uniref:class-II fumarase/aspartase family protein n=1 Tax=Rhodoferax sp. OV413 TaxID=1855285 RepID=UPI00088D7BD5|nr:adenylosuccinate lyase family protein [Rhodoferax sp. OV413]SDO18347.1 3-carboxy-cis,cis-muconate cycloisomerase [Rhodoferax sp. OV413]